MNHFWKKSIAALAITAVSALGMAGVASAQTPLSTSNCGDVLSAGDYYLTGDMLCYGGNFSTHGLIIGQAGVTIDGKGFTIYGTNPSGSTEGYPNNSRSCLVAIDEDSGSETAYECIEHGCRSEIDSGVYNAKTGVSGDGSGCDNRGGVIAGQGGCSGVTVKNLGVQGFCDGIFMSGTCFNNGNNNGQRLIDDILIEGNAIAKNGKDCGNAFTTGGSVGYWGTTAGDNAYFNDGIFVAMAGEETSASGFGGCGDYNGDKAVTIIKNTVKDQKGCGKESCPGGNNINIEGGVEEDYYGGDEDFFYVGCIDVARNVVKNAAFSGIQASHAISVTDIDGNIVHGNNYGGITYPCDFGEVITIQNNRLNANRGPGIAGLSPMNVINNDIFWQKFIDLTLYSALSGIDFPYANDGIYVGGEAAGSYLTCNIVGGRQTGAAPPGVAGAADITATVACDSTSDRNQCYDTSAYADANPYNGTGAGTYGCTYRTDILVSNPGGVELPWLQGDLNGDDVVDTADSAVLTQEWSHTVP